VETTTYGSALVASRVAMELILEVRYMLWLLGVALDGPEMMLGDNISVVLNPTVSSTVLKKKVNTTKYHGVIDAIILKHKE
jgi:hypothetical protein